MKTYNLYLIIIALIIGYMIGNQSQRTKAPTKNYTISLPEEFELTKKGDKFIADSVGNGVISLSFDNPQNQ